MSIWVALALAADEHAVAAALARARAATAIETRCRAATASDEIVICANRTADRYRLPLETERDPGDARTVDARGERERLLAVPQPACGTAAFLSGCGFVGATMNTRTGMRGGRGERPLAK